MSGFIDVCSACGGSIHLHPYDTGKYTLCGGWCPECQRPVVTVPEKAYDDDEYDAERYACEVASKVRKSHYQDFKVIDTPEFQFKWTERPTGEPNCLSCIHGYRLVLDGEDIGESCRKGGRDGYLGFIRTGECNEYEPRDTWYNMGSHCRNCYWSYVKDKKAMCMEHNCELKSMTEYDRGHCKSYEYHTMWDFETLGFVECPECHGLAKASRYGRNKCRCGYSWTVETKRCF